MTTPESLPTITIDPNGYEGNMAIDSTSGNDLFYFDGPKSVYLPEGEHFLNTGATWGGKTGPNTTYIYFSVNSAGEVTLYQTESASLSPDKKKIILNTVPVTINPGSYQNSYVLSAKNNTVLWGKDGKLSLRLVRYQRYTLDSSIHYSSSDVEKDKDGCLKTKDVVVKSWFNFFVDEKGLITFVDEKDHVTPDSVFASFSNGEITLKTVNVFIDPSELSGNVPVLLPGGIVVKSRQEITALRGLLTWVKWPNLESDSYYFVPL